MIIVSTLIKGMKMPETCDTCPLSYDCYACILDYKPFFGEYAPENFDPSAARLPTCPLEETTYIEVEK